MNKTFGPRYPNSGLRLMQQPGTAIKPIQGSYPPPPSRHPPMKVLHKTENKWVICRIQMSMSFVISLYPSSHAAN